MVIKIDYDTIKLQKLAYDDIFMMLYRLCNRKYGIKMTSQKFFIFKPLP